MKKPALRETKINGVMVEDTFCEAFDGLYCRLLVTAQDEKRLKRAVLDSTALPCTVFGESEAGVEKWLKPSETLDSRLGAVIQIWVAGGSNARGKLEYEVGKRIRQGILVVPTTTVFNALESEDEIDVTYRVGNCGDGFEFEETHFSRNVINVPVMMGSFRIERFLGYAGGTMGGNLWFMCDSVESGLKCLDAAEKAVSKVGGVVLSFREGCSAGSKAGGRFKHIGPTTNHWFCPTLRGKIGDSKVPTGVESIPEVVLNGVSLKQLTAAMKAAADAASHVDGLVRISAGNYGGKLGEHKIYLRQLFQ